MLFFFFFSFSGLRAQVSAEIYADPANKKKDTVDFGIVYFENDPIIRKKAVTRSVYIRNNGTVNLSVPEILAPYFLVGKRRVENTQEHLEFRNKGPLPSLISPGVTDSVFVEYTPDVDTGDVQSPIGEKIATITLRPCPLENDSCGIKDASKLPITKEIVARVFKSRHPLTPVKQSINFDSMYVNTFSSGKRSVPFRNISPREITLSKTSVVELGSTTKGEFQLDAVDIGKLLKQGEQVPIQTQYSPQNRGHDSASVMFVYAPGRNERIDSSSVRLYGFGAQQELRILSVFGKEAGATITNKDTIFLDPIPVGSTNELTILFENTGNTNIGLTSQVLDGDDQFVLTSRMKQERDLRTSERDTVKVTFSPIRESDLGYYETRLVLRNNIGSRIPSAPDSVRRRIIVIRSRALNPIIKIIGSQNDTLNMGEFFLPHDKKCRIDFVNDTLRIKNTGNVDLRIQTPELIPVNSNKFLLLNAEADSIKNGNEKNLIIQFFPETLGKNIAQIEIRSNDQFRKKKSITLIANVYPPDTIKVAVPNFVAKDGLRLTVPLFCRSLAIQKAQKATLTLSYDDRTIRLDGAKSAGSSAGGKVQVQNIDDGVSVLSIDAVSGGTFFPNDTLCLLEFSTYLGSLDKIPLIVSDSKIGTVSCPEEFVPDNIQGSFTIDSVCIIAFNHINRSSNRFGFRNISPNPLSSQTRVTFELAYKSKTTLRLFSPEGILIREFLTNDLPAGFHSIELPSEQLSNGVYLLEMSAGKYKEVLPLVVEH